jgi:hypothetical protein
MPRYSPPSTRQLWRARLPRNSAGSHAINPSHPPPRDNSPFTSPTSLAHAPSLPMFVGANSHHSSRPIHRCEAPSEQVVPATSFIVTSRTPIGVPPWPPAGGRASVSRVRRRFLPMSSSPAANEHRSTIRFTSALRFAPQPSS